MPKVSGTPVLRREDPELITGVAKYTDDFSDPEMLHMAVARSQYSHAQILDIDTTAAEALDGVVAVYTAEDLEAAGMDASFTAGGPIPGQEPVEVPILADEVVRHPGEGLAVVVAEDRYTAHDAADLVDVDYERLDSVTDPEEAMDGDAPALHENAPNNVAFESETGDEAATDAAFEEADHVVELEVENQRVIPNPMEPRGAYSTYDQETGELTIRNSTQAPHRDREQLASRLDMPEERIHVKAPSVGGGFGTKVYTYEDEVLTAWCTKETGRPVKWTATRSEGHITDHHGRDVRTTGKMALTTEGEILGLRLDSLIAAGAYHHRAFIPVDNFDTLISGQYEIPALYSRFVGAFTNAVPVGPYRGAGRPEAIFILERLMDQAAAELDIDPVELRRRNQIPADAFPYETAHGIEYGSGNYQAALDLALKEIDYSALRDRQARLREECRYLGIGICCFVENTGSGPPGAEWSRIEFDEDGQVNAYSWAADQGQGHDTSFSQLLADRLGVDFDDVKVHVGDSDAPEGAGTFGSRSAVVAGSGLAECADDVIESARELAADRLEVLAEDITFSEGEFSVRGAPERSVHIQDLASSPDVDLASETPYETKTEAFAFGTHAAVVEVDPELGEFDLQRYVAVDDCGVQLNPMIVEGQVHGGVGQGLGQALYERAEFDDVGTLVSGSFQDYAMPRAMNTPEIETEETVTPCPTNPLGVKGSGESGTLAAPPTMVNAVVDALRPLGLEHIDMPITPEAIWRACQK